jgi:hypothetical protein
MFHPLFLFSVGESTMAHIGHVAELVYAYVSEAYGVTLESSSLSMPTSQEVRGFWRGSGGHL